MTAKGFSMFEHALNLATRASYVADLGYVSTISRSNFDEQETFIFRSQVPCLEYVSLMIENAILLKSDCAGRVYAGFERLSRMEAVADRYLRIADLSERVFVFGEADWTPPRHPRMKTIVVASDTSVAREWFVISNCLTQKVALVAKDEDGFDAPVLEARHFRAFKTHDPKIIARLTDAAENLIDELLVS